MIEFQAKVNGIKEQKLPNVLIETDPNVFVISDINLVNFWTSGKAKKSDFIDKQKTVSRSDKLASTSFTVVISQMSTSKSLILRSV